MSTQYASLALLDAAETVAHERQVTRRSADRQRAIELMREARENLNLPDNHAAELLNVQPEEVTIRDSGAFMPVAVRGLYIFFPSDKTRSLVPVLVNKESRAEIAITADRDDIYEFIHRASIA